MSRLLLVRHGETEWNLGRRLQGQCDVPLSPAGREQIRQLAPLLASYGPQIVVSSPLTRATESARELGLTIDHTDERLMEAHLGDWEGLSSRTLAADGSGNYQAWRVGGFTPPGAETFADLTERVAAALNEIGSTGASAVAVFTHGGVIRAALAHMVGVGPSQIVPASPASLTVVDGGPQNWRLAGYNMRQAPPEVNPSD